MGDVHLRSGIQKERSGTMSVLANDCCQLFVQQTHVFHQSNWPDLLHFTSTEATVTSKFFLRFPTDTTEFMGCNRYCHISWVKSDAGDFEI